MTKHDNVSKWWEAPLTLLILTLMCIGGPALIILIKGTPVAHAYDNNDTHEWTMRQVKALETIAAALCTTPGHGVGTWPGASQCKPYQVRMEPK